MFSESNKTDYGGNDSVKGISFHGINQKARIIIASLMMGHQKDDRD